jgi:hypothetical protein
MTRKDRRTERIPYLNTGSSPTLSRCLEQWGLRPTTSVVSVVEGRDFGSGSTRLGTVVSPVACSARTRFPTPVSTWHASLGEPDVELVTLTTCNFEEQ